MFFPAQRPHCLGRTPNATQFERIRCLGDRPVPGFSTRTATAMLRLPPRRSKRRLRMDARGRSVDEGRWAKREKWGDEDGNSCLLFARRVNAVKDTGSGAPASEPAAFRALPGLRRQSRNRFRVCSNTSTTRKRVSELPKTQGSLACAACLYRKVNSGLSRKRQSLRCSAFPGGTWERVFTN